MKNLNKTILNCTLNFTSILLYFSTNFGFTKKKIHGAVEKVHGALPIYTIQNNGQVSEC